MKELGENSLNYHIEILSGGNCIKLGKIKIENTPEIIFISPVLSEIYISETKLLMNRFPSSIFVGMPQGWIRKLENNNVLFDFSKIEYFPYFDLLFFFR